MFSWNDIKKTYQDEVEFNDGVGKIFGMAKLLGKSAVAGATVVAKNAPAVLETALETRSQQIDRELKRNDLTDEQRLHIELHKDKLDGHLAELRSKKKQTKEEDY